MTATNDTPSLAQPIMDRIAQRLKALDLSERRASMEVFGHASAIRNIRTGATKDPGVETLAKLAPVLQTSPAWLAYGVGSVEPAPAPAGRRALSDLYLPVTGEVAAGHWMELDQTIDHPVYEPIPVPCDPRWPAARQYVLITRGTSINRVAKDGDYLACLDTRGTRYRPAESDLVIVERRRDGGGFIERTAKRYRPNGPLHEFWPDSDDPRWVKPIVLDPSEESEDVVVEVVARVTWVHKSLIAEGSAIQL